MLIRLAEDVKIPDILCVCACVVKNVFLTSEALHIFALNFAVDRQKAVVPPHLAREQPAKRVQQS